MARTLDEAYARANELLAKSADLQQRIDAARDNILNKAAAHPALPYAPTAKPEKPGPQAKHPNPWRRNDGSLKTQAELDAEKQPQAPVEQATYAKAEPGQGDAALAGSARRKAAGLIRQALRAMEAAKELENSDEDEMLRESAQKAAYACISQAFDIAPGFIGKLATGELSPADFAEPTLSKAAKMSFGGDPSPAEMPKVHNWVTNDDLGSNPHFSNEAAVAYAAENAAKAPGSVMHSDASWSVKPIDSIRAQEAQAKQSGSQVFNPPPTSDKIGELARTWGYDAPELSPLTWKAFGDKGTPGKQDQSMTRVVEKPLKP